MPKHKPLADPGIIQEVDDEELPDLSAKELIYLENLLAGETSADAYRIAHPNSKMTDNSLWVCASRLKNSHKIKLWVSACKKMGAMRAACTVETHLVELDRLKELAIQNGNMGAAVRAEELRAKAAGLYIAKDPGARSEQGDQATIAEALARFGPGIALKLCQELGYDPREVPCLVPHVEKQIEGELVK